MRNSPEKDPVKIEWKRLVNFARIHGLSSAAEHVTQRIMESNYPLAYSYRMIELLLRLKKFEIAGKIIKALDDVGTSDPLIDTVKAAQLWGIGRQEEAIEFSKKSAHRWSAPWIYYQVSKFLARKGQSDESEYYFGIAAALAKQEEELFELRIVLPDKGEQRGQSQRLNLIDTSDFIDDPRQPLFLLEACSVFAARGVRFEIAGFFKEPLPVSTADDLVYLLEDLPSFFAFLEDESSTQFELGFWGQGIETVFLFIKLADGNYIDVRCSSRSKFALARGILTILRSRLGSQVLAIVEAYREGLRRFLPGMLNEPWNQKVFAAADRFRKLSKS